VVIDGTLIPVDRIAVDRPYYSGKHKRPPALELRSADDAGKGGT
jgi:hypothetical protein